MQYVKVSQSNAETTSQSYTSSSQWFIETPIRHMEGTFSGDYSSVSWHMESAALPVYIPV